MGGGLMQLVAYGAQDIYLTGNPQITFFKVVYRRHTNFSMEAIMQTFNGSVGASASTVTATISRNGDLVSNLWLDVKLNATLLDAAATSTYINWTNNTGHAFVKDCEIEIGGQRIDRHYSQWLDVYNELTDHEEQEWMGLNKHAAKNAYLKSGTDLTDAPTHMVNTRLYVPLKFWFCRNPGLALPLIALQYHEVKLKLTTRDVNTCINCDVAAPTVLESTAPSVDLYADYIYLDTDERRRFAQVSHEYLIEQVQRETGTMSASQTLNFNHPVKELIWVVQGDTLTSEDNALTAGTCDATANVNATGGGTVDDKHDYFNYITAVATDEVMNGVASNETFGTLKLQLNGHDRFSERNASYFRTCQPIQAGHKVPSKHIYCYSFALKPEEHQPSGTCNFSRIDNAKMLFTGTPSSATLTVYAVNYNVLRIMSGMGGLAYSN
jgi:transcription elongation factor Elf1